MYCSSYRVLIRDYKNHQNMGDFLLYQGKDQSMY